MLSTADSKCDAIWENPPHVAQGNFAINKQNDLEIVTFLFCFVFF